MHSLLKRQIRAAKRGRSDDSIDLDALLAQVEASYLEFERERRLNDRAERLMEDEIMAANARIQRETNETLAAVFRGVQEGLLRLSADGRILSANPEAERIFNLSERDLVQHDLHRLLRIGEFAPGTTCETEIAGPDGATRQLEVSFAPYQRADRPRLLALVRDVTEHKARERALIEAREAAETASLSKSHFLASMSHELRTPLNAILGFSEVIRDRHFGDDALARYAEYADGIHKSGTHLLSLIDDILDLSKIESGGATLRTEPVDLGVLTRDAVEMMRGIAANKGLDVRLTAPNGPVTVAADARTLRQVALNLLSNAVKFTPPEGRIEAIVEDDGAARLIVRDTGVGISREDMEHLFEPFHRGNSETAREHPGTGLGLAITRKLVEMHGGRIDLESDPGRGTSVTVSLPQKAA